MSLAEVLLSLGMCVVVILSAMALSISALRSNEKSADLIVAQAYANQVLDKFIYDLPAASEPFWASSSFTNPYLQDSAQLGTTRYDAQLHLLPLSTVSPGLLRCVVNVSWKSGQQGRGIQGIQATEISRLIYAR